MDFHCKTPELQTTSASPSEVDAVLERKKEKTRNSKFNVQRNYSRRERF